MEIKTINELNKLAGGEINIPVEDLRLVDVGLQHELDTITMDCDYSVFRNLIGFVSYKENEKGERKETLYLVDNYGKKVAPVVGFYGRLRKSDEKEYKEFFEHDLLLRSKNLNKTSIYNYGDKPLYNKKADKIEGIEWDKATNPKSANFHQIGRKIVTQDTITLDELAVVAYENAKARKRLAPEFTMTPEQKKRALALNAHRAKLAEIL